MSRIENWLGEWVVKWRWAILVIAPLVVILAASGMANLKFTNNYRVFFSEENPQLTAFSDMEDTYSKDDNVIFVLSPKNGDVFAPEVLKEIEELTEAAWQTPFSIRVDSITNFQYTEAEGDDMIVRDLVEGGENFNPEQRKQVQKIALEEPLLLRRLISPDSKVTGINVTIQLPGVDETKEVPEVAAFSRELKAQMLEKYPDVEIRLNGMVFMNNAFSEASKSDMGSLTPLAFGVMLVVLGFLLRGVVPVFGTLLVMILSTLAGLGIGGYLGFPLTPPAIAALTIIPTIAIADCVHILSGFAHEQHKGADKRTAMIESLRVNFQPVLLTSVTTAIGFMSMNFSDAPPFQHLGNFSAFGVMAAFFLSITFMPAVVMVLPSRSKGYSEVRSPMIGRLGEWVVRRQRGLFIGMGVLTIVLIAMVPRNELNDTFVEYFDETVEFRRDADYLDKHLGGLYRVDYSLPAGAANDISKPEFLNAVDRFAQWARDQPDVVHVNTITDTMKRLNKNMHGDDAAWYRLPEKKDLAAQYLLLYEMSLPYGLDLNNQINVDKSAIRVSVTLHTTSTKGVLGFEDKVQAWFAANAPEIRADGASPTVMFAHIGQRNIRSMLGGIAVALVLISFILMFALRSFKLGLLSLVPNLVPAAMGFGLWGLFVGEVGLALSVVASMTLGIVVDDTVHFLSKYLRARREQGMNAEDAVRYAFASVGTALAITSAVLVLGFLVLATSHFELNSGMGLLTAIVITFALITDFFLLPPLLMKFDGDNYEQKR